MINSRSATNPDVVLRLRDAQAADDREAMTSLVADGIVLHVGGSRAAAIREDVEQNVLMALWQRLGREQSLDLTPSYVYKAVLRETVRLLQVERTRDLRDAGPVAVEFDPSDGSNLAHRQG